MQGLNRKYPFFVRETSLSDFLIGRVLITVEGACVKNHIVSVLIVVVVFSLILFLF